ncbi:acyltransferase family protein [Alteromonas sp. BMJM2]|uniref:acyltransferase family protein n=1 Tax=Alteromonas sp. BMJM2 TaxID=2954241 RepID=UPI0022B45024|nr:acyltransferase [Alteromonas sp. BMJM2]
MKALHIGTENKKNSKIKSYPAFDLLRFVLASIVVLEHANFQFLDFMTGSLAVKVFFALSGWLIGGILLRSELSELPKFFFNRSTRIWIPYFVAIVILYSIAFIREGVDFFWVKYLIKDLTFTHHLYLRFPEANYEMPLHGSGNQFWSICVEEIFYLFAPIILLLLPKGKSAGLWLIISITAIYLKSHFGAISLGVLAAIVQNRYEFSHKPSARVLSLLFICISISLLYQSEIIDADFITPIFSIAVVVFLAFPGPRSSVAMFLGGVSYPLYLNHWLGLAFVNGSLKHLGFENLLIQPLIAYVASIFLTVPLYIFIDKFVMAHREKWFSPSLGKRLGVAAYCLLATGIIASTLMDKYGPHGIAL